MDWSIALEEGTVIYYPQIQKLQIATLNYPVDIENRMKTALCMTNQKKLRETFQEFQNYFNNRELIYEPRKIKESYLRFIWSVVNVAKELGMSQYQVLEQQTLLERIMNAVTREELKNILTEILNLSPEEETNDNAENQMRLVIRRTKSLVHEFYARGITLEEIAKKLNVTPEYLGSQFHKEVGLTFSTYMKEYRIQKAKKLLIGTNLKLYEIAKQVGYETPKYFSKIFREVTGQLPAEYRKMNK